MFTHYSISVDRMLKKHFFQKLQLFTVEFDTFITLRDVVNTYNIALIHSIKSWSIVGRNVSSVVLTTWSALVFCTTSQASQISLRIHHFRNTPVKKQCLCLLTNFSCALITGGSGRVPERPQVTGTNTLPVWQASDSTMYRGNHRALRAEKTEGSRWYQVSSSFLSFHPFSLFIVEVVSSRKSFRRLQIFKRFLQAKR